MKERCIDIRCIFFFAVILHRINDNKDNILTTIETIFETKIRHTVPTKIRKIEGYILKTISVN